ncbi:hypothetical protein [Sphingobacterium psychroaquaticum]|nr:hypothetical protein [Sphingobacterium psychroaquaticum]QBQ40281.1 hypothetical protein E2P86_03605 [Sphingobacterium psychroaquaticum]
MDKLILNIPKKKSTLIKKFLNDQGISYSKEDEFNSNKYKQKLKKISTWSKQDLEILKKVSGTITGIKIPKW